LRFKPQLYSGHFHSARDSILAGVQMYCRASHSYMVSRGNSDNVIKHDSGRGGVRGNMGFAEDEDGKCIAGHICGMTGSENMSNDYQYEMKHGRSMNGVCRPGPALVNSAPRRRCHYERRAAARAPLRRCRWRGSRWQGAARWRRCGRRGDGLAERGGREPDEARDRPRQLETRARRGGRIPRDLEVQRRVVSRARLARDLRAQTVLACNER
jgi:hypothetical protein